MAFSPYDGGVCAIAYAPPEMLNPKAVVQC